MFAFAKNKWFPELCRTALLCACVSIIGLCCVILPPFLIPGGIKRPYYGVSLFPWFATAIENCAFLPTWSSFFALGIIAGFIHPRFWWLFGPASLALLPVALLIDLIAFPASHNLFPIELVCYIIIGLPVFPGTLIGGFLGKKFRFGPKVANRGPCHRESDTSASDV